MVQCHCLKANGQRCTRDVSNKPQDNPLYCWQHQKCATSLDIKKTAPVPIKKTAPVPIKKTAPVPIKKNSPVPIKKTAPVPIKKNSPVPIKKNLPQLSDNDKKTIAYMTKDLGACVFDKWAPIKVLGKGNQGIAVQVCHMDECDYVLKKVTPLEAQLSQKMGLTGLSPVVFDTFTCQDETFIVMERMDGDLEKLLHPPQRLDEILPQVLDLIYRSIVDYGICQNDTKIQNFLWKQTDQGLKIFLADYGIAKECPDLINDKPKFVQRLIDLMSVFNSSFVKPGAFSGLGGMNKPQPKSDWVQSFLVSENLALKNDPRWSQLFPDVHSFAYGHWIDD